MSRAYDSAGKRISSKTHARRGHECEICGRIVHGNGGKVAHGRSHVRAGEAVELVKDYADGPLRAFIAASDAEQIARLIARGFTALESVVRAVPAPERLALNWSQRVTMRMISDGRSPSGGSSYLDTRGLGIPGATIRSLNHRGLIERYSWMAPGWVLTKAGVDAINSGACDEPVDGASR